MTQIANWDTRGRWALVAAAGILNLAACGAGSQQTDTRKGAVGSDADLQYIYSMTDLQNMDGTGNYQLANDLYADGFDWHYGYFYGTLDGANHTIWNLTTSDSIGEAAGLFVWAENALIKNLNLINANVSGTYDVGGLVGDCLDCEIDNVGVEGTMTAPVYAGGILGSMGGGHITNSYFKGQVTGGGTIGMGGLVGTANAGYVTGFATVEHSYAQAASQTLVSAGTASGNHPAGGIVGAGTAIWVNDVYAVGDVTGRGGVGGLVGQLNCDGSYQWFVYNGIYRGNVIDANISPSGGWAGVVGSAPDESCYGRFAGLFYNTDLDGSAHYYSYSGNQQAVNTAQLKQPTFATDGVFCLPDSVPGRCGDNAYATPPWDAGDSSQYHSLMDMPVTSAQPLYGP